MKFIIDAHLPKSIALCFRECDVIHTSDLDKGNCTTDKTINEISVLEERILITKDTDFYYSFLASRQPFKLILVKLGNLRLKIILDYFQRNAAHIIQLMDDHAFVILEIDRIRILE